MKIKEMSVIQRPRERLVTKGAECLSEAELLAILINSGTSAMSALDIANVLLADSGGNLSKLSDIVRSLIAGFGDRHSGTRGRKDTGLIAYPGISEARAVTLAAAFELGRRACSQASDIDRIPVTGPEIVYGYISPRLRGLDHEECWILYLNRANYIVDEERISSGNVFSTSFDTRTIVRKILERRTAVGVILVHNHPSGNPVPGSADISCTSRLKDALSMFDLSLHDHLIVSDDCYFSFDEGEVRFPFSDGL